MRWVILGLILVISPAAWADPPRQATLAAGEAAPFAGVLLSEELVDRAMEGRLQLEDARIRLHAVEAAAEELERELAASRAESGSRCPESWWCRHGLVVGIVVGAVGAGLAVWGAVSVLEARR